MAFTLFSRTRARSTLEPPAVEPEPWPETGETWTPEGVTVVERYTNQTGAVVFVFSTDDQSYHHVVACLGCHYAQSTDPDKRYSSGLTLMDAGRIANAHATSRRALPRDIPARPDDEPPANSCASGCAACPDVTRTSASTCGTSTWAA
ncbi:hypothetical protein [Streptomyces viridosporus]|uniref:hypothetical protein n=1 Tax=Streptomyces viridosporus TaxID=67581 RepID=UPI00332319AE